LDRLRGLGIGETYIELERDAWIMLAAQIPDIDAVIAEKHRQLDEDPDMTRLYRLLSSVSEWSRDDPRVIELADIIEQLRIRGSRAVRWRSATPMRPTRSLPCSTRPWPSPRRSPDGSWRSSSNAGGVAGRSSNESPKGESEAIPEPRLDPSRRWRELRITSLETVRIWMSQSGRLEMDRTPFLPNTARCAHRPNIRRARTSSSVAEIPDHDCFL